MVKNKMTDVEKRMHKDLRSLIEFADCYRKEFYNNRNSYARLRTVLMWNNFTLIAHNANSIMLLIEKNQIYTASAIARIIIEQWINLNYFYSSKSYEPIVRYLYHGDRAFIDNVEKYREFSMRPGYTGNFTDKDFDEIRTSRDTSIEDLRKYGFRLKKMPDIRSRAESIDITNGNSQLEELYMGYYLTNSMNIHSSKDVLFMMTHAQDFDEVSMGYGLIENQSERLIFITNQILASTICFVRSKSSVVYPTTDRDIIYTYNAYNVK